jgi:hypothetical protein
MFGSRSGPGRGVDLGNTQGTTDQDPKSENLETSLTVNETPTSVEKSNKNVLAEANNLRTTNATIENSQVLLKSRIRELEHKSHLYIMERTELRSQLCLMTEKQRAAERQWAAEEEERVQKAVDSRVHSAVEIERRQWREEIARVREGAREEIEAERQWWRGELGRIQQEAKAEVEQVRREAREAAKERIRTKIRQAERDLALLEMEPEVDIKLE